MKDLDKTKQLFWDYACNHFHLDRDSRISLIPSVQLLGEAHPQAILHAIQLNYQGDIKGEL